jgi:amidase
VPPRPYLDECDEPAGALRIAVATTPPIDVAVDPECVAAARSAADLLTELGHDVVAATPPWSIPEMIVEFIRVWQVGPATAGVDDLTLLEPINRALAEQARATPSPEYGAAIMQLQTIARKVVAFWDDFDIVLTPTLAMLPVPIGWTWQETDGDPLLAFSRQTLFTPYTALINVTGQPAMSLPLHMAEGLPVGVQLIARPFDEATLVRLAAQLEEAAPWLGSFPNAALGKV